MSYLEKIDEVISPHFTQKSANETIHIVDLFPFIGTASISVLVIAWIIVSFHAWKVANSNPINALRYE